MADRHRVKPSRSTAKHCSWKNRAVSAGRTPIQHNKKSRGQSTRERNLKFPATQSTNEMDVPVLGCWWATAALLLGGVLYVYLKRTHNYWRKRGVPYVKPLLLFGNLKDAMLGQKNLGEVYQDLYWKLDGYRYGGVFKFRQPSLLVRDPELVKTILVKEFNSFHDNDIESDPEVDPLFGRNPFVLTGERWKKTRSQLTPALSLGKIKPYFPLIAEVCVELTHCIENSGASGTEFELKELCTRYTTDVVATCAFGIRGEGLQDPDCELRQIGRETFEPSFWKNMKVLIVMLLPRVAKFLKIRVVTQKMYKFLQRVVNEVMEYREKNNVIRADFLQHLITLYKKGGGTADGFTEEDIAAQASTFFFDGYETSSIAMAFGLYCLAVNPDVQTKIREEVDSILKKHGGELTFDGIQEMTYLDMALSEALRMYPPATTLMKVCTKPFELETPSGGTYEVEVGTPVAIPLYAIHNDPQHYPDPKRFDPERFSEENKNTRHRYSYLPFGDGPRMCLGFRFALLQIKAGIATVIFNFRISPNKRTPVSVIPDPNYFMLAAKGGLWLDIKKRTDK